MKFLYEGKALDNNNTKSFNENILRFLYNTLA